MDSVDYCPKEDYIAASHVYNHLTFTRAPITPSDVKRRYSNGRCLDTVFKNGYKQSGMCASNQKWRTCFCTREEGNQDSTCRSSTQDFQYKIV